MNSRQRRKERRRLRRAGLPVPFHLCPRGGVMVAWDLETIHPRGERIGDGRKLTAADVAIAFDAATAAGDRVLPRYLDGSPSRSMAEAHQRIFMEKIEGKW